MEQTMNIYDFVVPVEEGTLGYVRDPEDSSWNHCPGKWYLVETGKRVRPRVALHMINREFPPIPEGPLPKSYAVSGSIGY